MCIVKQKTCWIIFQIHFTLCLSDIFYISHFIYPEMIIIQVRPNKLGLCVKCFSSTKWCICWCLLMVSLLMNTENLKWWIGWACEPHWGLIAALAPWHHAGGVLAVWACRCPVNCTGKSVWGPGGSHLGTQSEWEFFSCAWSSAEWGRGRRALDQHAGWVCWWTGLGKFWMCLDFRYAQESGPRLVHMPRAWGPSRWAELWASTPPCWRTGLQRTKLESSCAPGLNPCGRGRR